MQTFEKYGANWKLGTLPIHVEMACIKHGGTWVTKSGALCGFGLEYHYEKLIGLLWPEWQWQRWSKLMVNEFTRNWMTAVMGPASSGKTGSGAVFALADYFCFPENTSWVVSSTSMDGLERRVWGEIKMRFKSAKARFPWLPGHVVESRRMLVTQTVDEDGDVDSVRDNRNGIFCVACLAGGSYVGLGNYVGLKNTRVRQLADELQFMPAAFIDAISNLSKNPDYKAIGFGNPYDRTDALGKLAEPADEDGGWDGAPDNKKTNVWNTRYRHPTRGPGRCIQLDGRDTPNNDYPRGVNPFKYLIKQEDIESDEAIHGKDAIQVSMMDYGKMPKDSQARRVITRAGCLSGGAFEEATWENVESIVHIGCMDAAYSGVGGDRTVLTHLKMGKEIGGKWIIAFAEPPTVVPVTDASKLDAPDQIAHFTKQWALARGIQPHQFGFDGSGRSSVTSALGRIWSTGVIAIEFGGRASERPLGPVPNCSKKYRKFVSELWFAARRLIEAGQLRALPMSVFEEGSQRAWNISDGNFEDVEPKEDMKERFGRSPDLFDSFVCGIEVARRLGFRISVENARPSNSLSGFLDKAKAKLQAMRQSYNLETTT